MEDLHSDPRFEHIYSDPKFRLMPKSKRKVKIDSRFESLFSNKHFSYKTNVDKRGRPVLSSSRDKHVMSRFYHLSHDDDEPGPLDLKQAKQKKISKKGILQRNVSDKSQARPSKRRTNTASEDDDNFSQNLLTPDHQVLPDVTSNREQQTSEDDDEQTSEDEDEQTSEDEDEQTSEDEDEQTSEDEEEIAEFNQEFVMEETELDHKWNELHADAELVVESTRRLAVCNMDWDFVKAQDLFILFKSFVPKSGHIKSVTIYPSEFGKQRMAEEARLGPQEMRECTQQQAQEGTGSKRRERAADNHRVKQCEHEAGTAQTEKLREYQLNRLRYYFAVVECDSVVTADSVYGECDGREYQLSSIKLDLRFIPNDMTFHDQPKDVFSQEQSVVNYQPHRFTSTALSQAKVDVTWDQTDFDRLSRSVAKLQHKELEAIVEENQFSDIIAPPESDSEEEQQDNDGRPSWLQAAMEEDGGKILTEEERIAVYRKVLMSKLADDEEEDGELDQEYVWQPGLKPAAEKKVQRKQRKEANTGVVSELLEKRRDKKRRKKEERLKKKKKTDQECADDDDEVVVEENKDSEKSGLKKKKKLGSKGNTEQRAQLNLLFMDSSSSKNDDDGGGDTKRRRKRKNCAAADSDQFVLDVNDPRFAALYTSHLFHIDPNSSHFNKKSKNMRTLLDEQIKKRSGLGSLPNISRSSAKNTSHLLLESLKLKIKK